MRMDFSLKSIFSAKNIDYEKKIQQINTTPTLVEKMDFLSRLQESQKS